jgi:hypothetical protein
MVGSCEAAESEAEWNATHDGSLKVLANTYQPIMPHIPDVRNAFNKNR